jgi:hypothetical protein
MPSTWQYMAPPTTNGAQTYRTDEQRGKAAGVSDIHINGSKHISCIAVLPGTVSNPRIPAAMTGWSERLSVTTRSPACIVRERFQWSTAVMVRSTGWADLHDTCTRTASHNMDEPDR